MVAEVDTDLLARILKPEAADMSPEAASFFLSLCFSEDDHARMAQLNAKASEGELTPDESRELRSYIVLSDVLAILHSKARRSIKAHPSAA
jgi:hypothetical protein